MGSLSVAARQTFGHEPHWHERYSLGERKSTLTNTNHDLEKRAYSVSSKSHSWVGERVSYMVFGLRLGRVVPLYKSDELVA